MASESVPSPAPPPQGTLLESEHVLRGGHMVDFHGWRMPLYYQSTGILAEHRAVRTSVGLFDVSHMGIITLRGETAKELLSRRLPTNAAVQKTGQCKYSFFLDTSGVIVDDAVLTRLDRGSDPREFLLVVNASMAPRILEILMQHRPKGTDIQLWNGDFGIIAVQGPGSRDMVHTVLGAEVSSLSFYTGALFSAVNGTPVPYEGTLSDAATENNLISRTGYTGELGYELFLPARRIAEVWNRLVEVGGVPCGLGARDTLRMEKGYLLSGTDFQRDRTPLEGGLDRFLAFDHPFVGREALEKQKKAGDYPVWTGLKVTEKGVVPRTGTPVVYAGTRIGTVTSGGLSPTLGQGIALAYLNPEYREPGRQLGLEIRGKTVPAGVVRLPFV